MHCNHYRILHTRLPTRSVLHVDQYRLVTMRYCAISHVNGTL